MNEMESVYSLYKGCSQMNRRQASGLSLFSGRMAVYARVVAVFARMMPDTIICRIGAVIADHTFRLKREH